MNAYQRKKCEDSVVLLSYLRALEHEMEEHCKKHARKTLTVCTKELTTALAAGLLLCVVRRKHQNGKEEYEYIPFKELIDAIIADIQEEIRLMGGKEAA